MPPLKVAEQKVLCGKGIIAGVRRVTSIICYGEERVGEQVF